MFKGYKSKVIAQQNFPMLLGSGQVPNPIQHKNKEMSDFPYFHFFKI
jgi:hypothetical protein